MYFIDTYFSCSINARLLSMLMYFYYLEFMLIARVFIIAFHSATYFVLTLIIDYFTYV